MIPLAALALLAAQAPFGAGQAPYQPAPGGQPSSERRYPGVSDAGNAILARGLNAPDQGLDGLARQQRGLRDAIASAATQPTVDVDQLAGLLKQRDDAAAQFRQRLTARLVAVMRQLSPADRSAFARALATPPGQGGQPPMPPR